MKVKHIPRVLILCGLVVVLQSLQARTQQNADDSSASIQRDGQHDFDFELGSFNIHLKKLLHPLTDSTTWVEFDGTSATRKVWDGRSQLEEFETDSPAAGHIEGLTLRLYNPQSHQWSLYWANSKSGAIFPPQIGEFKNGKGEFYAQDMLDGKSIFIRFVWSDTTTNRPHFEQSFSADGGKTWEVNWITDQTRVDDGADKTPAPQNPETAKTGKQPASTEPNGQHDFDFEIGTWRSHGSRLLKPLTGSTTWVDFDGSSVVRKVWNGRANLVELEADGQAAGRVENLSLRLFDPQSHQWSLYYASSKGGTLSVPAVGEFKNGRGEFYDTEPFNGRNILVRNVWSDITSSSCHFEQAFSDDGGKTWEVNWVTTDTRINDESNKTH